MHKACVAIATVALLGGCASVKDTQLTATPGNGPRAAQTIGYTGSASTVITAMSPAKAAFGLVGALAEIETGKRIVRENGIEDPAEGVARSLAGELAAAHSSQLAATPLLIDRSGLRIPSPEAVAGAAGSANFVVDVETQGWGFAYYPVDWGHYHVLYTARVRLVDAASKTTAAEHFCKWDSDKREPKLTSDELLDGKAAGFKSLIAKASAACADEFRAVLGLSAAKSAAAATTTGG